MKITTKRYAFLPKASRVTPDQLQTEHGTVELSFMAFREGWEKYGYTYVGEAEVTIEIPDVRTLVENKIAALQEEAAEIRAKATKACTEIDGLIQNLLAIEFTPAPAEQQ